MADSTLTLTYTQATKKVVPSGTVAIREASIDVTVIGAAALVSDLVLKIQDRSNNGATTPIGLVTSWTVSGANLVGTLNLNTTEAIAAFANSGNLSQQAFNLLLYTSTSNALMCNGVINLMNFPSSTTAAPVTLDQQATIDALEARIVELESQMATTPNWEDFESIDFSDLSTNAKRNDAIRLLLSKLQGN